MIHCLSCKRYPTDAKVIPYGSDFPSDEFMVSLISKDLPNSMSISSADVVELPSGCKFAVGSKLHVVNGNDGSEVYVWNSEEFVLVESGSSVVTYTITFMDNSGTNVLDTQSVEEGNDAIYSGTTPVNTKDSSLTFLGWSSDINSHHPNATLTNIHADMIVYASFEEQIVVEEITDSWDTIVANVLNGTYDSAYKLGSYKPLNLGSEGTVNMQIVAKDTDELADGSGTAPLTFISMNLLANKRKMYESSGSESPNTMLWDDTAIGVWMNSTLLNSLPISISPYISSIIKYQLTGTTVGESESVVTKLFIPSIKEVAYDDESVEDTGIDYRRFYYDNTSRAKGGKYWLRSRRQDDSTRYWAVGSTSDDTSGALSRNNSSGSVGVCLGFCLNKPQTVYTVTFKNEFGDTTLETQNIEKGQTVTYSGSTPVSSMDSSLTFLGWSNTINSHQANAVLTNIQNDMTVYAAFENTVVEITDSWDTILTNIDNGTYSTKYKIGNYKPLDLGTEGIVNMQIVAKDADELSDNNGYAPLTFLSMELIGNSPMVSTNDNTYVWTATLAYDWLHNTLFDKIPPSVSEKIKTVKKYQNWNSNSDLYSVDTKLFIPSLREIDYAHQLAEQGNIVDYRYIYYSSNSRIKNNGNIYWLRSRRIEDNQRYHNVQTNGTTGYENASSSRKLCFGFCL